MSVAIYRKNEGKDAMTKTVSKSIVQEASTNPYIFGRKTTGQSGMKTAGLSVNPRTEFIKQFEKFDYGGKTGVRKFANINEAGEIVKGEQYIKIGNRDYRSNPDGIFTTINGSYLNEKLKMKKQHDEYVKRVMELIVSDDNTCMDVLGMNPKQYIDNCGKKAPDGVFKLPDEIPNEIKEADCRISILNALPDDSANLGLGYAKLRAIINVVMPVIDDEDVEANQNTTIIEGK